MEPAKVLIVDDHALFRHGVRTAIERDGDLQVVGETDSGIEALARARELGPDLILMEISLPDGSGLEAVHKIKHEFPEVKVVVLTIHDGEESLFGAIREGAEGFLTKDVPAEALLESLRGVMRGEACLSRRMTARVLHELARMAQVQAGRVTRRLTSREHQVLHNVTAGLSNSEIARALRISENTVKVHITHILEKLQLENRTEAAAYARRLNLYGG
jgi:DNA-binding NarL/FixJ family response regulator